MSEPCENCGTPVDMTPTDRDPATAGIVMTVYPGPIPMRLHEMHPAGSFAGIGGVAWPAFYVGPEHTPQRCREARAARKVET